MMLVALIVIPVVGGLAAWAARRHDTAARWIALVALALDAGVAVALWAGGYAGAGPWMREAAWPWIPALGIEFHLGVDGLSLILVFLTLVLGFVGVAVSWREVNERVGFFHFNLLWILAGIIGVFLALDMFLFYFFWELMLVPMYFLIGIWGHERRVYAATKFFIFTQASGLAMLLAILGLVFVHYRATGVTTFEYAALLGTSMSPATAMWLMIGFTLAFFVKVPAFPLHTWLPDAHTEAPTAGSVVLAGLLLKTGVYGLMRFAVPFFPDAAAAFAPVAMTLGAIGILYGAVLAFAQTDLKRLVAYTSVSHMGFVLVGIYAWNERALQGVVAQMICHGLSTGGLFVVVGMLQERMHTRELADMGGLWKAVPRMGAAAMVLAMASLGLPGLGNFVAEFLTLVGAFAAAPTITIVATVGLVVSTVYSLRIVQRVFHGRDERGWRLDDLSARETAVLGVTIVLLVWIGLYPQPVFDAVAPALHILRGFWTG